MAIVPPTYDEWNINQALTLFRPSSRVSTGWLYIVLCGGANLDAIVHETRGSAGQTNISLSQCRDFQFPVPSVDESHTPSRHAVARRRGRRGPVRGGEHALGAQRVVLPHPPAGRFWRRALDTSRPSPDDIVDVADQLPYLDVAYLLAPRSIVVFEA